MLKLPMLRGISMLLVLALAASVPAAAQHGAADGQWRSYSGDPGSTKYSALDQINAGNIQNLGVAWKWDSPDNDVEPGPPGGNKVTPLYIDGVLYTATMYNMAAAIDASTGETLWVFDPEVWKGRRPGNLGFNARGLAYWTDGQGDNRIFLGTQHNYLYALDAKTGKLVDEFGDGGKIDLIDPYRRPVDRGAVWAISPSIVVGNTVIIGRAINDGPSIKEMPPGDVFGFDVRTGALKWTFYNPPRKGEMGYDTWEDGSAEYTGNSNVWTMMSADEELGLAYLPFGTPTNDWYGGHRKGNNLFAESLVCVNAETGKLVWYFQHVHHGLWDYDLPAAPALIDVTVDGRDIKALAQITKQGFVWVLDRTNGKPLWPIEERPVPQSTVEGEQTSPTQPFPTKPAAYDLQGSTEDTLIDYTPELKAAAIEILKQYNFGPLYTPPMEDKPTLNNPGWGGGANWSGLAADPETGMIYIPSLSGMGAMTMTLSRPDAARSNFRFTGRPGMGIRGPEGLPLFKGPYARITAIDLNTGDHVWQVPIGDGPTDHPKLKDLNLGPLGGRSRGYPLLTKSLLLLFTGGDVNLRAIDKKTGKTLHETGFDGISPSGPAITYMHGGKQYIAFSATSGRRGPASLVAMVLQ